MLHFIDRYNKRLEIKYLIIVYELFLQILQPRLLLCVFNGLTSIYLNVLNKQQRAYMQTQALCCIILTMIYPNLYH